MFNCYRVTFENRLVAVFKNESEAEFFVEKNFYARSRKFVKIEGAYIPDIGF